MIPRPSAIPAIKVHRALMHLPQVRKREQEVANMRDASYDAKDAARNARLRVG